MSKNPRPDEFEDEEDFGALLEQHMPKAGPKAEGELLDATVVGVFSDEVLVTYGSKEEVAIPIEEFRGPGGEVTVRAGDTIRVLLAGVDEDGEVELSYKLARSAEAARMLQDAANAGVPVRGKITRVVNGGVIVDVGMPAFLPASQLDLYRVPDLNTMIGQDVEAYVLEYDPRKGRAVLSRRKLMQERQNEARQTFLATLAPGATLKGKVKDVVGFGAFVLVGPVEGLIPRSELTYDRGVEPSSILKPGDEVQVKILELDKTTGKLTFSRKRVNEDPWLSIEQQYPVGSTVTGKVVTIQSFGAFVQLQEGITGLVHAKDISWESGRKSPQEAFREGDTVTCQVTEIDKDQKRLALSVKHLARDPWQDLAEKYPIGSKHTGTVTQLRDFGAFVKLDDFTEGLLHISDLSWVKRFNHPKEVLEEGQQVEVVILNLDPVKRRISLGMKQTTGSPFEQFLAKHPVGSLAKGTVSRMASFGAFIELLPGLEGLIHISELDDQRVDTPERVVRLGDEVQVKVLDANAEKQRISLSRKQAIQEVEQENIRQYLKKDDDKPAAGLSAFAQALQAAKQKGEKKGK